MKKTSIRLICIFMLLLFLPNATFAVENISINTCQPSLMVTVEFTGSGRRFDITTYISNIGDEQVTVTIMNFPGGGFKIHNAEEELVYYVPNFVFPMEWNLTLEPGQTEDIFSEFWRGVDDSGGKLPSGNYSVIGFVNAESGNILSEPVNIFLGKAKNNYILQILNHLPIMEILQSFFYLFFQFIV